ncbi:MAG: archaeosine biosynthesis radical SAM protein RaSEA [Thermoplasmata archaeon]|nr:archaeosine biosynthesis radical SAM protein RaSEA [Thermoplasmata archaeon]
MEGLSKLCRDIRENYIPKKDKKPRVWSEDDVLNGKITKAFVVILKTKGCYWARHSGCTMCGYFKDSNPSITEKDIEEQLAYALSRYQGEKIVKIFTSGSFLDEREISPEMQEKIIKKFFEKAEKVSIETRPEFVPAIEKINANKKILEISIGLESANDNVLKYSINKGFTFAEWKKAAEKVLDAGMQLKTYLLIKPPFLTEKEAIEDAISSTKKIADICNTISFNPTAVHGYTLVEYLWKRNLYRPPWLWSVCSVLKKAREFFHGQIKCDIVAGGTKRGAHNCGKCDRIFLNAIKDYTIRNKNNAFEKLECECKEEWMDTLEMEGFLIG